MVGYIEFRTKSGVSAVISGNDANGNLKSVLGPVSTEIIENSIKGKVVLVFGQSDFNLTPLIASLYLESGVKGDVLIGIPRNKYNQLNIRYYENFFSLIRGNGKFFYKDALWCSAKINNDQNKDTETIFDLDNVKFRPKWGIKNYKKEIETSISKDLMSGHINDRKLIVTFPLSVGFGDIILENSSTFSSKFNITNQFNTLS